ncbi:16S rRNA methyltransferase [Croceibacterium mercuriale]|uniref:Ribosomal RNA small subunit methyltransferase G n=1 Tax=Croceibacterium mercuriale TaxID=1572751 RepID=A0A0B2BXG8_9SPHN|nr:16S rRNA (guanine(527)-N(7))-methyltransferase RsmG [Croceibacterium mercuriale]KHL24687.1 16S rRNA methyltransferase [Croceibacterium mercuriale]
MIIDETTARAFCASHLHTAGVAKLDLLATLLTEENQRQNLVADASLAAVWQRHFADSLQLLQHAPAGQGVWLDLGTGAGFPGLPIALSQPQRTVVLVESRKRRVEWLTAAVATLRLDNVRIIGAKLEKADTVSAEVISARAFAPLARLLPLARRFSSPSTTWLLPKGRSAVQELAEQSAVVQQMFHVEHSITDAEAGILVGQGVPAT